MALPGEFNTRPLIEACWKAGKTVYLPVVAGKTEEKTLEFARYLPEDPLEANRYHILEPGPQAPRIAAYALDLVVLPLVAFDLKGNRLGSGSGYYDRTFAFLPEAHLKKPLLLGLAF